MIFYVILCYVILYVVLSYVIFYSILSYFILFYFIEVPWHQTVSGYQIKNTLINFCYV